MLNVSTFQLYYRASIAVICSPECADSEEESLGIMQVSSINKVRLVCSFNWKNLISETVFDVVNQENDKLDQKRKSKLAHINGHGELSFVSFVRDV